MGKVKAEVQPSRGKKKRKTVQTHRRTRGWGFFHNKKKFLLSARETGIGKRKKRTKEKGGSLSKKTWNGGQRERAAWGTRWKKSVVTGVREF